MEDIDGECEIWRGCYIWIQAVVADMDWDVGYLRRFVRSIEINLKDF